MLAVGRMWWNLLFSFLIQSEKYLFCVVFFFWFHRRFFLYIRNCISFEKLFLLFCRLKPFRIAVLALNRWIVNQKKKRTKKPSQIISRQSNLIVYSLFVALNSIIRVVTACRSFFFLLSFILLLQWFFNILLHANDYFIMYFIWLNNIISHIWWERQRLKKIQNLFQWIEFWKSPRWEWRWNGEQPELKNTPHTHTYTRSVCFL